MYVWLLQAAPAETPEVRGAGGSSYARLQLLVTSQHTSRWLYWIKALSAGYSQAGTVGCHIKHDSYSIDIPLISTNPCGAARGGAVSSPAQGKLAPCKSSPLRV